MEGKYYIEVLNKTMDHRLSLFLFAAVAIKPAGDGEVV